MVEPDQVIIDPRDKKRFYFEMTPLRSVLTFLLRLVFIPLMDMKVAGLENLPVKGPVIVAANHVTNFDVFPMQLSLNRPIFYMGKSEIFKNPVTDFVFRQLGAFPVNRGAKDEWAIQHAHRVLMHGAVLGMFPEGTRSKGRGLGVAKTGTARLSIETETPIAPMAIIGSDRFFREFPRRNQVKVIISETIKPLKYETPLGLTDRLMFTIAANLPSEMRGVYSEIPPGIFKTR